MKRTIINSLVRRVLLAVTATSVLGAGTALADGTPLKRLTLREDQLGWEAVGRLDLGYGYCTGTLIAADVVLTAAHCLFDQQSHEKVDVGGMQFRAGLVDGHTVAERGVRWAVAHPDYDPTLATGPESIRHDVALVLLDVPIPISQAIPFKVDNAPDSSSVSVVSYAQGRSEALSRQESCTVLGRYQGLFAFDCDVDFGSSGAPVFARTGGDRPRIVSIISAGNRDAKEAVAYGMELTSLLPQLQEAARDAQMQHGAAIAAVAPPPEERRSVKVGEETGAKSGLSGGSARAGGGVTLGGGGARFQRVAPAAGGA